MGGGHRPCVDRLQAEAGDTAGVLHRLLCLSARWSAVTVPSQGELWRLDFGVCELQCEDRVQSLAMKEGTARERACWKALSPGPCLSVPSFA